MANVEKASGIYPADLTESEQGDEIQKKLLQKNVSVIHENEQQSQKASKCRESRKLYLETFAETSKRTVKQIIKRIKKRKKRTRQSRSETIKYLREKTTLSEYKKSA